MQRSATSAPPQGGSISTCPCPRPVPVPLAHIALLPYTTLPVSGKMRIEAREAAPMSRNRRRPQKRPPDTPVAAQGKHASSASFPPIPEGPTARTILCAAALATLTLVVFFPALSAGYIWDDDVVFENTLLRSAHGLWTLWTNPGAFTHYFPLSYSSFWIDYHLWGTQPFGYHLVNLLFHAANAVLLYLLLRRIGLRGAWLAAALFAIHPVQSASVAWVVERKNLLCGLFYLSAFHAWLSFERAPRRPRYALVLALFVLAMLGKTIAVTFPVALVLLAWWRKGRIEKSLLARILPFLIAGAALAAFSTLAHQKTITDYGLTPLSKGILAGRALCFYTGKLLWPVNLMGVYPKWALDPRQAWQYLFPLGAAAVFAALWALRGRAGRGPFAALAFYALTLAPILGFIEYSVMNYSYVHDHHQYLACIGPFALFAAGLHCVLERSGGGTRAGRARASGTRASGARTSGAALPALLAAAVLLPLGVRAWKETAYYRNMDTFFGHNLELNPNAWPATINLGVARMEAGDLAQAEPLFRKTLALNPSSVHAMCNLATVLRRQERREEALPFLDRALGIAPDLPRALAEKGRILGELKRYDEARPILERVLEREPGNLDVMNNLAVCLLATGGTDEAESLLVRILSAQPANAAAHANLGILLYQKGKTDEAIPHLKEAVRLDPKNQPARQLLEQLNAGTGGR